MDVPGLLSTITTAINGYKTAVDTLDQAKITAATNELTVQLMHFGAEVIALQKDRIQSIERDHTSLRRIHDLENKISELEKRISERERYDLVEDYPGTIALRIKETARNGEPMHYLCPGCMDNKSVKSILQFNSSDKVVATCYSCNKGYRFRDTPAQKPINQRPLYDRF